MPQRECTKTKGAVTSPCKRISLPITMGKYCAMIGNWCAYREWVDEMIVQHPELFPAAIRDGYSLHDERGSDKLEGIRLRRICLKAGEHFDLAILDMHMPEMDGVELAQAIRELSSSKSMPLAMLSSVGRRESHIMEAGFVAYLHKPLKPSQLFDALVGIFAVSVTDESVKVTTERPRFDPELGKRHPLRILLAEDNLVNQKVALRILEQSGYRADIASNGKETLESVTRQPYDLILMDVQMPEMDGLEATRQVLARWPNKKDRPYIIAMTADAMESDREMCLAAGMDDYVAKPIRVPELMEALRKVKARR